MCLLSGKTFVICVSRLAIQSEHTQDNLQKYEYLYCAQTIERVLISMIASNSYLFYTIKYCTTSYSLQHEFCLYFNETVMHSINFHLLIALVFMHYIHFNIKLSLFIYYGYVYVHLTYFAHT